MGWEVLDIERGDVLGYYEHRREAEETLHRFVDEHPGAGDELVLVETDDTGHAVREPIPAAVSSVGSSASS